MLRALVRPSGGGCRTLLAQAREAPVLNLETVRTTVVVEQVYPPRLAAKGCLPVIKQKNRVLRFVDNTHSQKTPDIECILTGFVEGVGVRGDQLMVKRRVFRNRLLPAGLAVYATPDNVHKFQTERLERGASDEVELGVTAQMTAKQLAGLNLRVAMSGDNPWVLAPSHVRVALRKTGVEVEERCITLPRTAVMEPGEFTFTLTINKVKPVLVKGRVFLRHNDPSKDEAVEFPPTWTKMKE